MTGMKKRLSIPVSRGKGPEMPRNILRSVIEATINGGFSAHFSLFVIGDFAAGSVFSCSDASIQRVI